MATTELGETYASGWYLIAWSDELGADTPQPLRYFGDAFVLFRDEQGEPRLLDGHCPHLGAELGLGGVEAGEVVCPFHGWRFGGDGRCRAIPYASRIPPRARLRSYPVVEHSGMILAFMAPEGVEPDYAVPEVTQFGDPTWTDFVRAEIEIATEAREVIENIADVAHFGPVHDTLIRRFDVAFDGPRAIQSSTIGRVVRGHAYWGESEATYHGPAIQLNFIEWEHPTMLINAHIPVDRNRLRLRFAIAMEKPPGLADPRAALDVHIAAIREGYFQDVAIWENKRWRDQPTFVEEDGPIGDVRRWYRGFFSGATRAG